MDSMGSWFIGFTGKRCTEGGAEKHPRGGEGGLGRVFRRGGFEEGALTPIDKNKNFQKFFGEPRDNLKTI